MSLFRRALVCGGFCLAFYFVFVFRHPREDYIRARELDALLDSSSLHSQAQTWAILQEKGASPELLKGQEMQYNSLFVESHGLKGVANMIVAGYPHVSKQFIDTESRYYVFFFDKSGKLLRRHAESHFIGL